jgi:3-oxocholest-4-en-26-oate---CoA ligase
VSGWNIADVFEAIAGAQPDAPALIHAGATVTWGEMNRRADGLAATLVAAGAERQDKVAQYLYTGPEYIESLYGTVKAGLVPVNTNYRYGPIELTYLWTNADVVAVVFHGAFADRCAEVRPHAPLIRTWLWIDDGTGECPDWATPYALAVTGTPVEIRWPRSGDDLFFQYTGGTTGHPKGVMWHQHDLVQVIDNVGRVRLPEDADLQVVVDRLTPSPPRTMPVAPLMHGTGLLNVLTNLLVGGSMITLASRHFDPIEMLDVIERERVGSMAIIGDAHGKPMVAALAADPGRWDISSLRVITSSGVMWSAESKAALLRHNDRLVLVDGYGSTEAFGMAVDITTARSRPTATARFAARPTTKVFAEDGREVVPGSGERGRLAQTGRMPIGYYKDPERTAATYPVIDGVRYVIPGDWAEVEADGTIKLLGRGSQCINTGGEKVFPEEVEEALKTHPSVADAAVVGVPDDRFGQAIVAVVALSAGCELDESALIGHTKSMLAGYKAPKRVVSVETLGRAANGKLDYHRLTDEARSRLG